ncbi:metallophosphoesterase family protein [Virgibacillus oceani]|uniref:Phosphoesterase n=1 Tax=Virgibacillus oceani TaxID=1479511 RepID=A0A917GYZ0_9BACI|nr:metallophosphoesterase [Virgibacillus oceani]GGG62303.1 phosphoesterase [Virgibacillus oceani]
MPKVLIVSDSHSLTNEVTQIKERHRVDYMIHCGDSELDMDASELEGFLKVAGNCDFDNRYPNEQVTEIENVNFFVTHGHLYNVKSNLLNLAYRSKEYNAQVVCFGHTHIAGAEKSGNQLFINPGSIRQPRNRVEKTYAILEWDMLDDVYVTFYSLSGDTVDELNFHTSI